MLAVENLLGDQHDVWAVNTDDEYHEESDVSVELDDVYSSLSSLETTQPKVPTVLEKR